ncbi:iron-hydroxamate ABC transporter substrate-binding protein [Neobacillus cucumis]|uniref:iron-hydroxamate ABC transporter substrate-binding protein n=1 Tax=Neobacillus cucumis TaxID=1740721 RepID=UPI001FDB5067|nr:iron-hydroxamate ABC transporter substrate-binding protein [Neobacillus cucumis]MBM7653335.1 iron complex transport system substrate-binding protein [Neobacillus cucumis]
MIKKRLGLLFSILTILFLVSACSSSNGNSSDSSNKTDNQKTEVTLTDAKGKVVIPANPKRIIAPYLEDSLVALGVKPAAQWSIGNTVLDYLQPQLKGVPKIGWDMPLEQVINNNPDLIIFSSATAIQKGQYEEYKKIAPTYVYKDEMNADWRKQLTQMGEILSKQDKAKEALASYDKKAADAKSKIQSSIGDQSAAIIWVNAGKFYLMEHNRFSANVLYSDLGIKQPDFVKNLGDAAVQWDPIALEKLPEIKADHIFLISKKGDAGLDLLSNSSIWNGLDAVKNGHVYEMNDPSFWTINGLIASEKTIDAVEKALVK